MSENPRRGRQAINFTTNVPKILDLKSSSEQIFFRKLSLGAPVCYRVSEKFKLQKNCETSSAHQSILGLVQMMFGLVSATFSLPEWQVIKLTFFAP